MTDLRNTAGQLPFPSTFDRTVTVDLGDLGRICYALGVVERGYLRQVEARGSKDSTGLEREAANLRRLRLALEAQKRER